MTFDAAASIVSSTTIPMSGKPSHDFDTISSPYYAKVIIAASEGILIEHAAMQTALFRNERFHRALSK
jgi:hypothetical protein